MTKDLRELGGMLKSYAKKNKTIDEIIKMENEAVKEYIASKYKRTISFKNK